MIQRPFRGRSSRRGADHSRAPQLQPCQLQVEGHLGPVRGVTPGDGRLFCLLPPSLFLAGKTGPAKTICILFAWLMENKGKPEKAER